MVDRCCRHAQPEHIRHAVLPVRGHDFHLPGSGRARPAAEGPARRIEAQPGGQRRTVRQTRAVRKLIAVRIAEGPGRQHIAEVLPGLARSIRKRGGQHRLVVDRFRRLRRRFTTLKTYPQIPILPVQNLHMSLLATHGHIQRAAGFGQRVAAIRCLPDCIRHNPQIFASDQLPVQPYTPPAVPVIYPGHRTGCPKRHPLQMVAVIAALVPHGRFANAAVVHIVATSAVQQRIPPGTGIQGVIASLAVQLVSAAAGPQLVVARAAVHQVFCTVVFRGIQLIISATTVQPVRAVPPNQHVIAFCHALRQSHGIVSVQDIVAVPTIDNVAARLTRYPVVAGTGVDIVVPRIRRHTRLQAQVHSRGKGKIGSSAESVGSRQGR